ncbi:MAG: IclR family transcriptional regulator [Thermomicrobiales bacterium]
MSGDYQVRALARGLAILTSFTLTHPEQSLTAISTRLGLAKGTAVRLLTVLEEHGFVERAASERYRLGVRLFELGSIYEQTFSIEQAARPALESLARECQQTANLGILNEGQVVHIAVVPPQRPIHFAGQLGARELVHCTGLGKALIAGLAPETLAAIVAEHGLPSRTAKTITTMEALHDRLAVVRERGYATDDEESFPGLTCVAAPIRDATGATVAAISVSGTTAEFEATDYAPAVLAAASTVSHRLGYGVRASSEQRATSNEQ